MQDFNYTCPKCGNTQCEVGEFRAAGGFLSKIFDVQSKRFTTVICTRCQYTEIYRATSSMLGNIFDLFTNQRKLTVFCCHAEPKAKHLACEQE